MFNRNNDIKYTYSWISSSFCVQYIILTYYKTKYFSLYMYAYLIKMRIAFSLFLIFMYNIIKQVVSVFIAFIQTEKYIEKKMLFICAILK